MSRFKALVSECPAGMCVGCGSIAAYERQRGERQNKKCCDQVELLYTRRRGKNEQYLCAFFFFLSKIRKDDVHRAAHSHHMA